MIGYAIDPQVAQEVKDAAEADVAFLVNDEISASAFSQGRLDEFRTQAKLLGATPNPRKIWLGDEAYMMIASGLPAEGKSKSPTRNELFFLTAKACLIYSAIFIRKWAR